MASGIFYQPVSVTYFDYYLHGPLTKTIPLRGIDGSNTHCFKEPVAKLYPRSPASFLEFSQNCKLVWFKRNNFVDVYRWVWHTGSLLQRPKYFREDVSNHGLVLFNVSCERTWRVSCCFFINNEPFGRNLFTSRCNVGFRGIKNTSNPPCQVAATLSL